MSKTPGEKQKRFYWHQLATGKKSILKYSLLEKKRVIKDTNLLPHAEILFLIVIKQLPLLPQFVLGPGAGQVAGGEQGGLSVESLLRSVPGGLLSVRPPLHRCGRVPLLLQGLLLPQQRAREVGGVLEPWTPFLFQCQGGHKLRDNFIPLANHGLENQLYYKRP